MNKPETVTEAKRNTLIRAAIGMLQHERTAAIAIEMPGEPESFIAIGTAADIARALPEIREAAPASHPARRQRRGDRPTEPLQWEGESSPAATVACQHENGAPAYDHWKCVDCGAIKTDNDWGVASRRWFPSREAAKFFQEHGRMPESAAPAVTSGDAPTDPLAPMSVADAMRIVKANWGDMAAIEEAFTANAARIERAAAPAPTGEIGQWEGLTDLFGIIAAKHGVNDIQVNGGTADELFPRVLAEFIVAASGSNDEDGARFRWLNEDHDDAEVREQARSLAKRLGTSSYFAITRDIDAAMGVCAAAPATASGDELPPLPPVRNAHKAEDFEPRVPVLDIERAQKYAIEYARAAVSAATKPAAAPTSEEFRKNLLNAIITCGHAIEDKCMTLYRDPRFPGGALSQLLNRIVIAAAPAAPTAAPAEQVRDAARWNTLPAFFEEYQINGLKLTRDIDALLSAPDGAQGEGNG